MKENKTVETTTKATFPICSITFIVLLILKLTGAVEMSWLWVFAPFWIPIALTILILVVAAIVAGIVALVAWVKGE